MKYILTLRMIGKVSQLSIFGQGSKYTDHGMKIEPVARQIYSTQVKFYTQDCELLVCSSEPWLAYSPDGKVIKNGRLLRLLGIKCPYDSQDVEI